MEERSGVFMSFALHERHVQNAAENGQTIFLCHPERSAAESKDLTQNRLLVFSRDEYNPGRSPHD
jgi:hypothetical protein